MITEEYSDKTDIIAYEEKPISEAPPEKERIKIYVDSKSKHIDWKECLIKYWSFFAITVAFAAIFLVIYILLNPKAQSVPSQAGDMTQNNIPTVALPDENEVNDTEEQEETVVIAPIVLDESMTGIDISKETDAGYSLAALNGVSEGVKVIVIHSHSSEYVSESLSVVSVGEVLTQILNSGGIETYHCKTEHDAQGTLGAYERMTESLEELKDQYPEAVLVIDLHDSDSGKPFTYTVGTGFEYGWKENLKAVCAVSAHTSDSERVIRLLPSCLGQNSGILTLNVGICGNDYSDEEARKALAALADALMILFENKAPAENSSAGALYVNYISSA